MNFLSSLISQLIFLCVHVSCTLGEQLLGQILPSGSNPRQLEACQKCKWRKRMRVEVCKGICSEVAGKCVCVCTR